MDDRWVEVSASDVEWERRALDYLRDALPERAPYRVWSNASVHDPLSDSLLEIDALVLTRFGLVVVEIKSWTGTLRGDGTVWRQEHRQPKDNPLRATEKKARVLRSLYDRTRASAGAATPWISAVVWLSETGEDARLDVRLSDAGRLSTYGKRNDPTLPSLEEYLLSPDGGFPDAADVVTPQVEATVTAAMKEIGLRPRLRPTVFGAWRLSEELDRTGEYQDYLATHTELDDERQRRVRVYPTGSSADSEHAEVLQRAALREHRLLRGISYPGIPTALEYAETTLGPAVMFTYDPGFTRLDLFARTDLADLTVPERLTLLRGLAETVRYAHRRDLTHRALSPRSVWVRRTDSGSDPAAGAPDGLPFQVQVTDWVAGTRQHSGRLGRPVAATRHVADLVEDSSTAYLAPETLQGPTGRATSSPDLRRFEAAPDVFSLGSIGYLLLTGHPPGRNSGVLLRRLKAQGALRPSAVVDGLPEPVDQLIARATVGDPEDRTPDVATFLADLDAALAAVAPRAADRSQDAATTEGATTAVPTQPSGTDEPAPPLDPLTAQPGDELEGDIRVIRRLGSGGTAVALLAERDGTTCVLKVSRGDLQDAQLRSEAGALTALHGQRPHDGVVRLLDGPISIGGRLAIVLSALGDRTLDDELRRTGTPRAARLQDWGTRLIDTLAVLEETGTTHRDIKPANLAVAPPGERGRAALTLFDFSLAGAPLDAVELGTPPYLDPFLGTEERPAWDGAAERYAAAVTLYELATGRTPSYGTSGAHPTLTTEEVDVEADLADRENADALAAFFRTALARDALHRHPSADRMRAEWVAAFAPRPGPAVRSANLTRSSPVADARLSPNVTNALTSMGVETVGEALDLPPAQIQWQPGLTSRRRSQVAKSLVALRNRVPGEPPHALAALDVAADALAGKDRDVVAALLGLDDAAQPLVRSAWATGRDVATTLGRPQGQIRRAMAGAIAHWRSVPALSVMRGEIVTALEEAGGVMTAEDLSAVLVERVGSDLREPLRSRLATAVLRAAIEAELADADEPRLAYQVRRTATLPVLIAAGSSHGSTAEERLSWANALGQGADRLARQDRLPSSNEVSEALRQVASEEGMPAADLATTSAEHLVRVAAAASYSTALTPRLEVYPVGMSAASALTHSSDALAGAGSLSTDQIAERVRARFPRAEPLPARPLLDDLLQHAEIPLRWDPAAGVFVHRSPSDSDPAAEATGDLSPTGAGHESGRDASQATPPPRADNPTDDRLARSLADGGWLILTTTDRRLPDARRALGTFPIGVVDVEQVMTRQLRQAGVDRDDWDKILKQDPLSLGFMERRRLGPVAGAALEAVREQVAISGPAAAVLHIGLMARYDAGQAIIDDWRRQVATQHNGLRTLWLLVGWSEADTAPTLTRASDPSPVPSPYVSLGLDWIASRLE